MVKTRLRDNELPNRYPHGTRARYVGPYAWINGFVKDLAGRTGKPGVAVRLMRQGEWQKVSPVQAHVLSHRRDFQVRLPSGRPVDNT